jgi:hypothetical protein
MMVAFIVIGVAMDVVGISWEAHADKVLSPSQADTLYPFVLPMVATIFVLVGSLGATLKLATKWRAWTVLLCVAVFLAIPGSMRLIGDPMNVHGWTFLVVWPMIQSMLLGIVLLLSILNSAIRHRFSVGARLG